MAGIILKYETGNSTDVPINDDISKGELVLNTQAGKVWYGDNSGNFAQFKITTFDATADRLFYSDSSGNVAEIGLGTDGQVLTSTGDDSAPAFESISSGSGTVSSGAAKTFAVYNSAGTTLVDSDFNGTGEPDGAIYYDTTNYGILKLWRMDGSTSGTNGFGALYFGNEDFNSDFTAPNASIHCTGGGVTQASGSEGGAALVFKTIKAGDAAEETRIKLASDGAVELLGNSDNPAKLRLYEDTDLGTNYTEFKVGTQAADINYTLPTDDGSDGEFLQTDGDGVLAWEAPVAYGSSGSGNINADNIGSGTLPMARLSGTLPALNGSALTNLPLAAQGALMDSELAGLAAVKATTGTFLSADESKLDGIAASATANAGTVTSVTAGTGMTQSGTSTVNPTLNVIGGTGITANSDDIALSSGAALTNLGGGSGSTYLKKDGTWADPDTDTDTVDMGDGFVIEDGDGTEVTITENKEVKFIDGAGIDINWTDTSTGSDGDPYDLTFTVDHDAATNFVANEHLDWTSSVGTIHSGNYTNTTYSVGDGGLTTNNFTDADHSKLDGIAASATANSGTVTSVAVTTAAGLDGATTITSSGTVALSLDLSELSDGTSDIDSNDEVIYLDNGTEKRKAFSELKLGQFSNDQNWTSNSGDITGVTAGSGMSGGGSSGAVTLTNAGVTSAVAGSGIDVSGATGAVTISIGTGEVVNAMIGDDEINSEHYAAGSIDNEHIADNAINSEHYADGSIDNAHIADDAINSEHYADGSIDTAHIADDQITLAKMAGITRGSIIIGNSSGNPTALAIGSNDYVLTSDGTDIAWEAAAGGGSGDMTGVDLTGGTGITIGSETGTTSGDYSATITNSGVTSIVAGTGVSISGATGAVTVTNTVTDTNTTYSAGSLLDLSSTTFNVDLSELTDGTGAIVGSQDELVYLDNGSQKRKLISEITLSDFSNDSGWTTNSGDITGVTAGTGLSGGGSSGGVTLNVDAAQTQITSVGTIGTGVWNGTAVASAYLDSDTAHLSTTQTFSGAKTFSSLASFTMDGNTITGVDDSGEFTDDDAHIMTSAAVQDKILGYGYSTATGDITGVTAGTGLSGGGSSGGVTLNVDASQTQITSVGSIGTGTWAATDVAVTHGGTGSSSASGARSNLGVDPAGGGTGLNPTAISGLVDTTIADADYLMFWDATDSSMKKVDAAELTAGGGGGGVAIASGDTNNYVMTSDGTGDSLIGEAGLTFSSFGLTVGAASNTGTYKVYDEATLRTGVTGSIQTPAAMAANPFTGEVAIISTVDTLVFGGIVYNIP